MTFDIISITDDEVALLSTVQQKLLRTAQQKKNEMLRKLNSELEEVKILACSNGMENSTYYAQMSAYLTSEYETDLAILVEQLQFNMSLKEPTTSNETGDSGQDTSAYLVDYELSYIERYISVRDYYLSIEDPDERLALLAADEVAQNYLGTYYSVLYDYLASLAE